MSGDLQAAKSLVWDYHAKLSAVRTGDEAAAVLAEYTTPEWYWRGVDPLGEHRGAAAVATHLWDPLLRAFHPLQRRPDVFIAGDSDVTPGETWVLSMGHLMGLFDEPWLGIPPTRHIAMLRYAEYNRVEHGRIAESALFLDVLDVMRQAGHFPLPPATGTMFTYPGPRTHDGLLRDPQDPRESAATLALVNRMIAKLIDLNHSADERCPPEFLEEDWNDDMLWYGPAGIGASYTVRRYQQHHQFPFRLNQRDKTFNGHVARIAEGTYAGFFGWANLTTTPTGGFMGLPGNEVRADMRIVDVYRREGDKLAENWVFIDMVHWLGMQGLDVLGRMHQLLGGEV